MFNFEEFGKFVRTLRKRERITQEELAGWLNDAIGDEENGSEINKDHISRIERGKIGIVALEKYINALAQCLRLTEPEKVVFFAKANIIYTRTGFEEKTIKQTERIKVIRHEIERIFTHIRLSLFCSHTPLGYTGF